MPGKTPSNAYLKREKNAKWQLAEAKQTARLEKSNLVLQETPMIFTVPKAGRYCIGMDYGQASDETVAALMRMGEDGEPDELISILRRDKVTGKWEQEDKWTTMENALCVALDRQVFPYAGLQEVGRKFIKDLFEELRKGK